MRGSNFSRDTMAAQKRGWFLVRQPQPTPRPLFEGPKCLRGVGVKDCTWAAPMACVVMA